MTTTDSAHTRSEEPALDHQLKRRGVFAAAWAMVAAVVLRKTTEPVHATSGTGPDGNFVLGSNDINNTTNYASLRTQLVSGLNFSGTTVLEVNASPFQSGGSVEAAGLIGRPRRTSAGVVGIFDFQVPGGFPGGLNAGTYGVAYSSSARGVFGQNLTSGTGVLGQSNSGTAVLGQTLQFGGIGVQGMIPPINTENATAVYGLNYSNYAGPSPGAGGFGVYGLSAKGHGLVGAVASAGAAAVVGATNGVAGAYAAAFYGPVIVGGNFTVVGGAKSAAVPHPDGSHRRLYCMESPESWFEDFGDGELVNGEAHVSIEPGFAAVADLTKYHVFVTPYGDQNSLHVADRYPDGFRVRATGGTGCGTFSWRVVAKRKDIVGARLEPVTIPPEPTLPPVPDVAVATPQTLRNT